MTQMFIFAHFGQNIVHSLIFVLGFVFITGELSLAVMLRQLAK